MWKYIKAGLIILAAVAIVSGAIWGLSKLSFVQNVIGTGTSHSGEIGEGDGGFGHGQGKGLGRGGGNGGSSDHTDLENHPEGGELLPTGEHRGGGQTGSLSMLFTGTSVDFVKMLLIVALIAIPWAIIDQARKRQRVAAPLHVASDEVPASPQDTTGTN